MQGQNCPQTHELRNRWVSLGTHSRASSSTKSSSFLSRNQPLSMASSTTLRSVFLMEPWRRFHAGRNCRPYVSYAKVRPSSVQKLFRVIGSPRARVFHFVQKRRINCSTGESLPSSSGSSEDDQGQGPPQEAVLKAISEVSKSEGRVGQTTNVVIGGTVTDDSTTEWLALDKKVNTYPTVRGFTAIGTGGEDFVQAMVVAVESVIRHSIPKGQVKQKVSSGGKYVSVNIGPIQVMSSEQVQAVYNAMRSDDRMKYFL